MEAKDSWFPSVTSDFRIIRIANICFYMARTSKKIGKLASKQLRHAHKRTVREVAGAALRERRKGR